jgi:hypothetical protein
VQGSKLSLATAAATAASALRQLEAHLASGPACCRPGGSGDGSARRGVSHTESFEAMSSQLVALQQAQEQQVALHWQQVVDCVKDDSISRVE